MGSAVPSMGTGRSPLRRPPTKPLVTLNLRCGNCVVGLPTKKWEEDEDRKLAVDADFAEAQEDASAAHGTSEAQLRTELGKQKNLVELPLYRGIVRAG
jgi:hypothetical protein